MKKVFVRGIFLAGGPIVDHQVPNAQLNLVLVRLGIEKLGVFHADLGHFACHLGCQDLFQAFVLGRNQQDPGPAGRIDDGPRLVVHGQLVARVGLDVQDARIEVIQREGQPAGLAHQTPGVEWAGGMLSRSASEGRIWSLTNSFRRTSAAAGPKFVKRREGLELAVILLGTAHAEGHDTHIGGIGTADRHEGRLEVAQFEVLHRREAAVAENKQLRSGHAGGRSSFRSPGPG